MVHKNASHHCGGHCTKMSFPLPVDSGLIGQSQERLVDQSSRLQRMIGAFVLQPTGRDRSQFIVDQWHKLMNRVALTSRNAEQ
jgi:hypothetical protein